MGNKKNKRATTSLGREKNSRTAKLVAGNAILVDNEVIIKDPADYSTALLEWFDQNARVFFWRNTPLTIFQHLVVELLLQKTRAETVEPFARHFLSKYPDPQSILRASTAELEQVLSPLGLSKRRTRHLKEISKGIINNHGGEVPLCYSKLVDLKGVGPYVANAVLCFGINTRAVIIDSNVIRILTRVFNLPQPTDVRRPGAIATVLNELLPELRFRDFNYALLDMGALICQPRKPRCPECPFNGRCHYNRG